MQQSRFVPRSGSRLSRISECSFQSSTFDLQWLLISFDKRLSLTCTRFANALFVIPASGRNGVQGFYRQSWLCRPLASSDEYNLWLNLNWLNPL